MGRITIAKVTTMTGDRLHIEIPKSDRHNFPKGTKVLVIPKDEANIKINGVRI